MSGTIPDGPKSRFSKFLTRLTTARTFIFDAAVVGSVVALLYVAAQEVANRSIIIEEIKLPDSLTKMGYSGQVASLRLWDALQRINEQTIEDTDLDRKTALLTEWQQLEITEPNTQLSLRGMSHAIKKVIGWEQPWISGEVVCGDTDCTPTEYQLRIRVLKDGNVVRIPNETIGPIKNDRDIDLYLDRAALKILEVVDPVLMAEYYNGENNEQAERLAEGALRNPRRVEERVLPLLGQINTNQQDWDRASLLFKQSLEASSSFDRSFSDELLYAGITHVLWGDMLYQRSMYDRSSDFAMEGRDHLYKALDYFEFIDDIFGRIQDPMHYQYWGQALMLVGRLDEAEEKFLLMSQASPFDPIPHELIARIIFSSDRERADLEFKAALSKRNNKSRTYLVWGQQHLYAKEYGAARDRFMKAREADPTYAEVYFWEAYSAIDQGDYRSALESIESFVSAALERRASDSTNEEEDAELSEEDIWYLILVRNLAENGRSICDDSRPMRHLAEVVDSGRYDWLLAKMRSAWPSC